MYRKRNIGTPSSLHLLYGSGYTSEMEKIERYSKMAKEMEVPFPKHDFLVDKICFPLNNPKQTKTVFQHESTVNHLVKL